MDQADLDDVTLTEADRYIQGQIRHHRDQLSHWRLLRGVRILRELEAGRSPAEVAVAINASTTVVYALVAEARRGSLALGPSPERWWARLTADEREAFLLAAHKPYPLAQDLAEKMRRAGVVVAEVGFNELLPVLPAPYSDFLRLMAAETQPDES